MYAKRLSEAITSRGRLCVGIDPQPSVLAAWGLEETVSGLERCARGLIEMIGTQIAVFKPQSAFFEVFGSAGVAVLERVLSDISQCGALSVLDVKRGDIGSTMTGYAKAFLSQDAPLAADAITLSPYLGYESLRPAINSAISFGKGVYILARTSNSEGAEVQLAMKNGRSVAQRIVDAAIIENENGHGSVGIVVGSTHSEIGIDLSNFNGSILVPGIGAQGGRMADLKINFGTAMKHVLPTVSREILNLGPDVRKLCDKVIRLKDSARP